MVPFEKGLKDQENRKCVRKKNPKLIWINVPIKIIVWKKYLIKNYVDTFLFPAHWPPYVLCLIRFLVHFLPYMKNTLYRNADEKS